jgi:DNA repair protein RadC
MNSQTKLKLLPVRETPVSRVSTNLFACTILELLAAVIGGPKQIEIAESTLVHFGGDLHRMRQASAAELLQIQGIGESTAARLRAAFTLSSRLASEQTERVQINCPSEIARVCEDMKAFDQEHFRVIMLNTRNEVIGFEDVYIGSVCLTLIRAGEIFRPAIRCNATAVVFAHNHPSGASAPSPEDIATTRALVKAGNLLEIEVLDHLVIGRDYTSLKEKGLGFI